LVAVYLLIVALIKHPSALYVNENARLIDIAGLVGIAVRSQFGLGNFYPILLNSIDCKYPDAEQNPIRHSLASPVFLRA
jgi:hypothetical protein